MQNFETQQLIRNCVAIFLSVSTPPALTFNAKLDINAKSLSENHNQVERSIGKWKIRKELERQKKIFNGK